MIKKIIKSLLLVIAIFFGINIGNNVTYNTVVCDDNKIVNIKENSRIKTGEERKGVILFTEEDANKIDHTVEYKEDGELLYTIWFEKTGNYDASQGGLIIEDNTTIIVTPAPGFYVPSFHFGNLSNSSYCLGTPGFATVTNADTSSITSSDITDIVNEFVGTSNAVTFELIDLTKPVTIFYKKINNTVSSISIMALFCTDCYYHDYFLNYTEDRTGPDAQKHWKECHECGYIDLASKKTHSYGEAVYSSFNKENKTYIRSSPCTECDFVFIVERSLREFYLSNNEDYITYKLSNTLIYNGQDQTQKIDLYFMDILLIDGVDYRLENNVNKEVGTYKLTAIGINDFRGSMAISYSIDNPHLKVIVNDEEITYGDPAPNYSFTIKGFLDGDSFDDLSGSIKYNCEYKQNSNAGDYVIKASGLTSSNYKVIFVDGNLKVNPKEISSVNWENLEFTYDGNKHLPNASAEGLINNDFCAVIVSGATSEIGTHTATVERLSNPNYKLPEGGFNTTFKINPRTASGANVNLGNSLVYNGQEQTQQIESVSLNGVILSPNDYIVTNNTATDAGNYTLTIEFIGGYSGIITKDFVVAKQKVSIPTKYHDLVYTGDQLIGVEHHDLYNVENGSSINAGTFIATITLNDPNNYQWEEEFDGTIEWEIEKVSLIISVEDKVAAYGDEIPTYTVTYDGFVNNETKDVLGGTLNFECDYVQFAELGEYIIKASGLSSDNYNIEFVDGKLTVNKKIVSIPNIKTDCYYNGSEHTLLTSTDLYTVSGDYIKTEVGEYLAILTLVDPDHYKWEDDTFNGEIEWSITLKEYDMSGVKFEDKTVVYDGTNHALKIIGNLPEGISVSYSITECIEPGVYEIIATFDGEDLTYYNKIPDMKATLIINHAKFDFDINKDDKYESEVIITSEKGLDPTTRVEVELIEIVINVKDYSEYLNSLQKAILAYSVKIIDENGNSVQPKGELIIKLLIPEVLKDKSFTVMHIHNGNEKTMMDYEIEGDYVVITTDKLSEFVFVQESNSFTLPIIALSGTAMSLGFILLLLVKKKKQQKSKNLI